MFVLELARKSGAPSNSAVRRRHVHDHRSRRCCLETIRLREHVGDLIAAPAVSLDTYRVFIDESFIDDSLNRGQYAFQSALSGITDRVNDIRLEDEIPIAYVVGSIDARAG